MEKEIYQCFLGFLPPDTDQALAELTAKYMTTAAIDGAVKMGKEMGLTSEESLKRLLESLRYGENMPERGETIH
ncbi:hypothetical protein [Citrobacter koseri]|uniref:hypothetical protein n=1 Tax=Citrobacter koseri TaxID=545 RepID=UPI0024B69CBA|nr:hypothetical protein [Citrobacter koseri]MDI9803996.1 hypothetical protein [Citrobacter koseri]